MRKNTRTTKSNNKSKIDHTVNFLVGKATSSSVKRSINIINSDDERSSNKKLNQFPCSRSIKEKEIDNSGRRIDRFDDDDNYDNSDDEVPMNGNKYT